jgi:hypothetical protein
LIGDTRINFNNALAMTTPSFEQSPYGP